jgi:hypothetical protein
VSEILQTAGTIAIACSALLLSAELSAKKKPVEPQDPGCTLDSLSAPRRSIDRAERPSTFFRLGGRYRDSRKRSALHQYPGAQKCEGNSRTDIPQYR